MSTGKGNFKRGAPAPAQDDIFGAASKRAKFIEVVQKKKTKKDGNNTSGNALPSLGLGLVKAKNAQSIKIEALNCSNYNVGCLALGVVLSISETSATISLPGGCIGTVEYSELSDVLHKYVAEGRKVRSLITGGC